jgi:hypothetical protein
MKFQDTFTDKLTGKSFTVEIEINQGEVSKLLAARAFASKAGKSQALGGDVKCKIIKRHN